MPIEVKAIEQVQEEMRDAMLAVLDANGITSTDAQLGTLIGAAIGYAKSQHVRPSDFIVRVQMGMDMLELVDA